MPLRWESLLIVIAMNVIWHVVPDIRVLYAIPILLVLALLSFGIATFLLHFGVFVEDLSNVVNIGLRLLFYVTGIFYSVSTRLPEPYGIWAEKYNPLAFLLSSLRGVLLYHKSPDLIMLAVWFVVGVVISAIGIRMIYKNENSYVKVI